MGNSFTKAITINIDKKNLIPDVVAKNGDIASRFLKVTIMQNGTQVTIEPNSEILLNVIRSDGKQDAFVGTLNNDGTVTVPLTQWVLGCSGKTRASISIIKDDMRLTTTSFILDVQACEYDGTPSGTPEYDILVHVLTELTDVKDDIVEIQEEIQDLENQIYIEVGATGQTTPSEDLAITGLFLKKL